MTTPRLLACGVATALLIGCGHDGSDTISELVQYGDMRDAIGARHHEGRVSVAELTAHPHFYGIGALASLEGEVTVLDSVAIATGVTREGRPEALGDTDLQVTFFAGQSVGQWSHDALREDVPAERFDAVIAAMAADRGIDTSQPFLFVVEGEFSDVRLHVVNGACPIHARMKKLTLTQEQEPYELETGSLSGTIIGLHAPNAVGKLTHPATTTHVHLIFTDRASGEQITGHVEQIGMIERAIIRLPQAREAKSES